MTRADVAMILALALASMPFPWVAMGEDPGIINQRAEALLQRWEKGEASSGVVVGSRWAAYCTMTPSRSKAQTCA